MYKWSNKYVNDIPVSEILKVNDSPLIKEWLFDRSYSKYSNIVKDSKYGEEFIEDIKNNHDLLNIFVKSGLIIYDESLHMGDFLSFKDRFDKDIKVWIVQTESSIYKLINNDGNRYSDTIFYKDQLKISFIKNALYLKDLKIITAREFFEKE